jgi:hypothetical protein
LIMVFPSHDINSTVYVKGYRERVSLCHYGIQLYSAGKASRIIARM